MKHPFVFTDLYPLAPWVQRLGNGRIYRQSHLVAGRRRPRHGQHHALRALSAFLAQRLQFENEAWQRQLDAIEADLEVLAVINRAIAFARTVELDVAKALNMLITEVWDLLGLVNTNGEALN